MLKLAIMQPYLFPYIGYFQLINHVDHFILYDDVNYMKGKWINRNRIIVNNDIHSFTVPVVKCSQNKLINETRLLGDDGWKKKLLKTVHFAYKKAPEFNRVFPLIETIIFHNEPNLAQFIQNSIHLICEFSGIDSRISCSSGLQNTCRNDTGEDRIINLCVAEQATEYINLSNGRGLYQHSRFTEQGIVLKFISPVRKQRYQQFNDQFFADLSIIDVLMFNDESNLDRLLSAFRLD